MGGLTQILLVLCVLALAHHPLGAYMARVYTSERDWWVERAIYRLCGVAPRQHQRWQAYAASVLMFSAVNVVGLYLLLRFQNLLPLSLGFPGVDPAVAWNTACSFVTNTNWQVYAGESTLGYLAQMAGLTVQNFVSAGVGLCVAIALTRALAPTGEGLGNFWVDLTRSITRLLLPVAIAGALILCAGGVTQTLASPVTAHTLAGGVEHIMTGPVASQEAIKELGTNGGGFFNANSAHPFENPTWWTNLVEIALILLIPTALPRTFGLMVGDRRQGWAILAAMATLASCSLAVTVATEVARGPLAWEGKEMRFGIIPSSFFATATTLTSTGAVDSAHSSYGGFGGAMLMMNMLLGEIAPGGVGSGLYGMLIVAILAVFIAGLMVGRTPEYLGHRIGPKEMTLVGLYTLVVPLVVLVGTGLGLALPSVHAALANPGAHGVAEVLYAFASGANNNGSAFAGLNAAEPYLVHAVAVAMLVGRFVPICLVLALAGRLVGQQTSEASAGTLPTHTPLFVGVMAAVACIVTGLTFLPALALGPLTEGLL